MGQCQSTNKKGTPCEIPTKEGEIYCHVHRNRNFIDKLVKFFKQSTLILALSVICGIVANVTGILGFFGIDYQSLAPASVSLSQQVSTQNSFLLISTMTPILTQTATATPSFTPSSTPTATSTSTPTLTSTPGWSGILTIRRATLNEIRDNMVSIWDENQLDVGDISIPGTQSYEGTVEPNKEYLWPFRWCALDRALLETNSENIIVQFYVNGEIVPSEKVLDYSYDPENSGGWKCNFWAGVVSGWPQNTTIELRITYTILAEIYDGQQKYHPGDYTHLFLITVP